MRRSDAGSGTALLVMEKLSIKAESFRARSSEKVEVATSVRAHNTSSTRAVITAERHARRDQFTVQREAESLGVHVEQKIDIVKTISGKCRRETWNREPIRNQVQ